MKKSYLLTGALLASVSFAAMAQAQTEIVVWHHAAGDENFVEIITEIVADFNASQQDWVVKMESFPQASYNDAVIAAALAGNLPDVLDVDGPVMPSWAYAGYMQPLNLSEGAVAEFLPGTLGQWDGSLYSVGMWDAAVALMTRRSTLEKYDIRIPTLDAPWTFDEFDAALVKIAESGDFDYPLDLGMAWTGEWYPYAFSPFLQSFGGDMVDRTTYQTAEGALNGDAAMAFGAWWQSLFTRNLAPGSRHLAMTRFSCQHLTSATGPSSVPQVGNGACHPRPNTPRGQTLSSNLPFKKSTFANFLTALG
jgi:multiple sugar transport system substrate-binding protein